MYIKNNSDLSWYQAFRELQHRNSPVTGTTPGQKIRIKFSKKDMAKHYMDNIAEPVKRFDPNQMA